MKFVFRGIFFNTPEEWSFSMKFSPETGPTIPPGGTTPDDITQGTVDDALHTFFDGAQFSSSVRCTEWRAYRIGTNGKMEGNPLLREFEVADQPKGTGSPTLAFPTDTALVITTVADNRGPARFGRFYLPSPNTNLGTDARLIDATVANYLALSVAFAKSVSDSVDLDGTDSSEMLNISAVSGGHRQTVDHFRCGRILDHVERRRRSMQEEYIDSGGTIDW